MITWAQLIALLVGVPKSERSIYQIIEDEDTRVANVTLGTTGRWVFTYYRPSTYWRFVDTLKIRDDAKWEMKPRVFDAKWRSEPDLIVLKKVDEFWRKFEKSDLLKGEKPNYKDKDSFFIPMMVLVFTEPDESSECPPYDEYIDFPRVIIRFPIEKLSILKHGYFIIELEPPTYDFTYIEKWFRFHLPTDEWITLPMESDLFDIARDVDSQYCHPDLSCTVDVGVGYVEGSPFERQYFLTPVVVATYDAKTLSGEWRTGTLYFDIAEGGKSPNEKDIIKKRGDGDEKESVLTFGIVFGLLFVSVCIVHVRSRRRRRR